MAQDRALARGVLNHTPGSFMTKMRAVARGVSYEREDISKINQTIS
jgi:hypothetical protein